MNRFLLGFKNNKGVTLVEIMIASALLGGLALIVMNITKIGLKSSVDLDNRQESRDVKDQIYLATQNANCGLAPTGEDLIDKNIILDDTDSNQVVVPKLFLGNGDVNAIAAGSTYGSFKIPPSAESPIIILPPRDELPYVKSLDDTPDTGKTSGGYYKVGEYTLAELRMKILPTNSLSNGKKTIPFYFLVFLKVDGDKKITDCRSLSNIANARDACLSMNEEDGKIEYEWITEDLKCSVTLSNEMAEGVNGTLDFDDPGVGIIDPNYVL